MLYARQKLAVQQKTLGRPVALPLPAKPQPGAPVALPGAVQPASQGAIHGFRDARADDARLLQGLGHTVAQSIRETQSAGRHSFGSEGYVEGAADALERFALT